MRHTRLWPQIPVTPFHFQHPPREYGILPFWFLNGELDPDEMRFQIQEYADKKMPGFILHGRYGLELPYLGADFLDRVKLAVEEANRLGMKTWIYDEMNWPSGTADLQVLRSRPDLSQRYLECIDFIQRGPWFTYLTGEDSRYLDFERSIPVAAFAISTKGEILDLTSNLSFEKVIPWEVPPGHWRVMFIVEKRVEYYIDALNPEATAEFLRVGYEPYRTALQDQFTTQVPGFYTDEPAMHYYLAAIDTPVIPWTLDMLRRFNDRNGYNLRPYLPHLFFDLGPDSARVRYDFYSTLTAFYAEAFYKQIHTWCQQHEVVFTGHLLYEEYLRRVIRTGGNLFRHYEHMDVIGVDHLYPYIGTQDRPDEHVAMKLGSSAAHHLGSERLLCESFGGIFMDATMQRMKWITDWEYVLGVNLINPHGFHYTLEGQRKRDWPPSMFYQYPWWHYYGAFSDYVSRLSHLLSGGRHVAKVAVLWPIHAMMANYTPQTHNALGDRIEHDFNTLTDLLLRLHYDFDYLDEEILARAEIRDGRISVHDETYDLLVLPPMTHIRLETMHLLEIFAGQGGRLLGMILLPDTGFSSEQGTQLVDIGDRMQALFGLHPDEIAATYDRIANIEPVSHVPSAGGKAVFLRSYALARALPYDLQQAQGHPGRPESPTFVVDETSVPTRYFYAPDSDTREEITPAVMVERHEVNQALNSALESLITPDVTINCPDVFYLHRVKDERNIYFFTNHTFETLTTCITLEGEAQPVLWDASSGRTRPILPSKALEGRTHFDLTLPPAGSAFVLSEPLADCRVIEADVILDELPQSDQPLHGYGPAGHAQIVVEQGGMRLMLEAEAPPPPPAFVLDGDWDFHPQSDNALVISQWRVAQEQPATELQHYVQAGAGDAFAWHPMVPGAWSYQLPSEPNQPYPIPVWYQVSFEVDTPPSELTLIVDGFAGLEWAVYVNGQRITDVPTRSAIDSQMGAITITPYVQPGENLIALRLVLTAATDGLLDRVKLLGDFGLRAKPDSTWVITAPRQALQPCSWTEQGYPFYSGLGRLVKRFMLPETFESCRVFLHPGLGDDATEVFVNGVSAGVHLWPDHAPEITGLLHPGENELELRIANTLVNLLNGEPRPSGLREAPQLVAYSEFSFDLPAS